MLFSGQDETSMGVLIGRRFATRMLKNKRAQISPDVLIKATVVILFLAFISRFLIKPVADKRDGVKTIQTILKLWEKQDLPQAMGYWRNIQDYPAIYNLLSYNILSIEFDKKAKNQRQEGHHIEISLIIARDKSSLRMHFPHRGPIKKP